MAEDNTPLEYNVFALAFQEEGAISYFDQHLPPEAVGAQGNTGLGQFYVSLLDFYRKTGCDPIDPIAFTSWLETETEIYAALGGGGGVGVFIEMVLDIKKSTPEAVTGVLKHRWNKRKQLEALQELQLLVSKKEHKSDEDNEKINILADRIRSLENEIGYDPLANVATALQIGERADDLWELPDFLPTQFKSLNRAMGYTDDGGFCKGAVHTILAPSGKGKSTFSKCLMNHWVEEGHRVLYVNYEEARAHWERVLFTQVTKQNVYLSANLSELEKKHYTTMFKDKMIDWNDRFMVRHDPDTPFFDDLEKWLRDIVGHGEGVPDVVIIDTIQSMFLKGSGGAPRWGQFEQMMVRLEKLAKDMHCVMIITAQENVNRMKDKRDVVQQSDTGGSISIQQKSAVTIFITEKKLTSGDDSEDESIMQLQIPKNRITGSTFTLDPPLVRYIDAIKSYEEYELPDEAPYDPGYVLQEILDRDEDFL